MTESKKPAAKKPAAKKPAAKKIEGAKYLSPAQAWPFPTGGGPAGDLYNTAAKAEKKGSPSPKQGDLFEGQLDLSQPAKPEKLPRPADAWPFPTGTQP